MNSRIPDEAVSNIEQSSVIATNTSDKLPNTNTTSPPSSNTFSEIIKRLIMGQPASKSATVANSSLVPEQSQEKKKDASNNSTAPAVQTQPAPKRACRAPPSRRFAHPCSCSQSNINHKSHQNAVNSPGNLPAAAYTFPLHLYDPVSKKCLPTSRSRDMLLKECRTNVASPYPLPHQLYHGAPCVYDDLVCDARRNRCVCKQSLHLFYDSNYSAFGCVSLGQTNNPDGRACKTGQVYNVISKECQKIFDVNELPPTQTTGVSATQFSFVTIVLIWILLLILIVTAKLRKLRTSNMYRNSPFAERRITRGGSQRPQAHGNASAWLHPFIAAVNGHHHLNQHRTTVDRHAQAVDDSGNFSDTDFFLPNGNRRLNELFSDGAFTGSQLSLNNPPPKFEEIYPSCEEEQQAHVQPPSNEDLPTYDEAMKLRNTSPPDISQKE